MDGLECSEVSLSYLKRSNDIFRIDSSFFAKKYLLSEAKLTAFPHTTVGETGADIKSFGAYSLNNDVEYVSHGIPFLRCLNIKDGFIRDTNMLFITPSAHDLLWKSAVSPDTFLLTMSGTIGNVAIADSSLNFPVNSNQDIAKIHFNGHYRNEIALAFFMSCYGRAQIEREARGSVQQHVFLSQVELLQLPCLHDSLANVIEHCVKRAYLLRKQSSTIYTKALVQINGLIGVAVDGAVPHKESGSICVKTLQNSFALTGRLDAEYYQPQYDALFERLKNFSCMRLGGSNGIVCISKSIEPGSEAYQDEGIPFVRVSDVSKYEITPPEIFLSKDVVPNIASLYPKKDTILFSKDGSVGIAYKLEQDEDIVTSGALLHLTIKNTSEVLPDYLTLVLNSPVVQMQAERDSNGAVIQHWKPSEIENVIIPILGMDKQKELADMVQKSFVLRRQSKQLLEYAKQAVELAIEQGEDVALDWLNDKAE